MFSFQWLPGRGETNLLLNLLLWWSKAVFVRVHLALLKSSQFSLKIAIVLLRRFRLEQINLPLSLFRLLPVFVLVPYLVHDLSKVRHRSVLLYLFWLFYSFDIHVRRIGWERSQPPMIFSCLSCRYITIYASFDIIIWLCLYT